MKYRAQIMQKNYTQQNLTLIELHVVSPIDVKLRKVISDFFI